MIDDDLISMAFELTMQKPRERPNVWVCANPACPCPCWATSKDMAETPGASDCMGLGSSDFLFVQVKPMTGRCILLGTSTMAEVHMLGGLV